MCLLTDLVGKVETQWIKWVSCLYAGVAKLADAQDLKSCGPYGPCGFDSHPRHFVFTSGMHAVRVVVTGGTACVTKSACRLVRWPVYKSSGLGCPNANLG